MKERDKFKKLKIKSYADNKHNVKDCKLKIGDTVLVKNKNKGVIDSYYTDKKYIVTNVNGSMISAECNGHKIYWTVNKYYYYY